MTSASIPTYFSHSYRPEDRLVNKAIWEFFADKGFFFTVDPPTDLSSHTHLEAMMLQCSCFVAVVTYRRESPPDFCSQFVLSEFGLAVQSKTPKLLLVDENVPTTQFDNLPTEELLKLNFHNVADQSKRLESLIDQLAERALTLANRPTRPRNRLALLVPKTHTSRSYGGKRNRQQMAKCAKLQGMTLEEVTVPTEHNAAIALQLDRFECVILDVRGETLPDWVFAYLYGRFVPTIKLIRLRKSELASTIQLPPLVDGLRMDASEPGVESAVYWRDPNDLDLQLSRILHRLANRGTPLRDREDGLNYFDGLGRPPARVFVSNAGSQNDFAEALCAALERQSIEVWQYKRPGAIASGTKWPDAIKRELELCDVFVALLDKDYDNSEWCRREMRRARQRADAGKLVLLPFQVEQQVDVKAINKLIGDLQAPPVYREREKACQWVMGEIDTRLRQGQGNKDWRQDQPLLLGASREVIIDALRHLERAKYENLSQALLDAGIRLDSTPVSRAVQPRVVAEGVLRDVQQAAETYGHAHGHASTTSALVAALARLVDRPRAKTLESLLVRIETTMQLRRG